MKFFLRKILLFLLPVYIHIFIIVLVDPFNYFNICPIIDDEIKIINSSRNDKIAMMGNMLIKLNDFNNNPLENVIIGDSRANKINTNDVKKITGDTYYNLAVPGADFKTITDIFWFASQKTTLKKVYIALTFNNYGRLSSDQDLYFEANEKINKFYPFFTEKFMIAQTYSAIWLQIKSIIEPGVYSNRRISINKKEESENITRLIEKEKWEVIISYLDYRFKMFSYPEENVIYLKKIAKFCSANNIQLKFIIFPNSKDVHGIISKYYLDHEFIRFKNDILSAGDVVDFDFDNIITENNGNFIDPVHLKPFMYTVINQHIFTDTLDRYTLKAGTIDD